MRILFFRYLCFLFVSLGSTDIISVLYFLPEAHATTTYHASPNGSGSSCTSQSPCSLDTGISKAMPGDEIVLKDGVYNQMFSTKRSGTTNKPILIRAENTHKALIRKSSGNITSIAHNYLTIHGIRFDGMKKAGSNGGIRIGTESVRGVHHVIFENNIVENMGASCVHIVSGQHDIIIRHNLINGCGLSEYWGEAFYIRATSNMPTYNIQIYGNDVRGFTENGVDAKPYTQDIQIHHNIFSGQVTAVDYGARLIPNRGRGNHGTITVLGNNFDIHDNIMHDNKAGFGHIVITPYSTTKAYRNVAYRDKHSTKWAIRAWFPGDSNGKAAAEIYNNTFCSLSTYNIQGDSGLKVTSNNGIPGNGAPQSQCDSEVERILNEAKELARAHGDTPQGSRQPGPPSRLEIMAR